MKEVIVKMNRGKIRLEIMSLMPEKFLNTLWEEGIFIEGAKKHSIVSYTFNISPKDFYKTRELAKDKKVKLKVINSFGFFRLKGNLLKRKAFIFGFFIFIFLMYYYSTYIWSIEIKTENNVSPYEIRNELKKMGVKPGIKRKKLNIINLQNSILEGNKSVVWAKGTIAGTKLKIDILERQNPPKIKEDKSPCDLIAKKDGVIQRVYTKAGTSIVEEGQVVKKGDVLVLGEQGNEESRYKVKAEGEVIAKTFYEKKLKLKIPQIKRERTGETIINKYIIVKGKRIYLKNDLNKFKKYDKIEDNKGIVKKELYYEIKETEFTKDDEKLLIANELNKLYSSIRINFDNKIKIIQKLEDSSKEVDMCNLRVLVIAEEDIGEEKTIDIEEEHVGEDTKDITDNN